MSMPTIKASKRIEQQNILLTFIILIRINKITLRMKLSQMGLQLRPEALKGAGRMRRDPTRSCPSESIQMRPRPGGEAPQQQPWKKHCEPSKQEWRFGSLEWDLLLSLLLLGSLRRLKVKAEGVAMMAMMIVMGSGCWWWWWWRQREAIIISWSLPNSILWFFWKGKGKVKDKKEIDDLALVNPPLFALESGLGLGLLGFYMKIRKLWI